MHRQMPARHVGGEGGVNWSLNIFFLDNVFSPESLQYCQILLIFNHLTHFQPFSTLDDSLSMCWWLFCYMWCCSQKKTWAVTWRSQWLTLIRELSKARKKKARSMFILFCRWLTCFCVRTIRDLEWEAENDVERNSCQAMYPKIDDLSSIKFPN